MISTLEGTIFDLNVSSEIHDHIQAQMLGVSPHLQARARMLLSVRPFGWNRYSTRFHRIPSRKVDLVGCWRSSICFQRQVLLSIGDLCIDSLHLSSTKPTASVHCCKPCSLCIFIIPPSCVRLLYCSYCLRERISPFIAVLLSFSNALSTFSAAHLHESL